MNKKVLIILVISIMSIIVVGCTSINKYTYDYNKMIDISFTIAEISDTYVNSRSKNDFKKEMKKKIKNIEKIKMKTKEGKDVKKAYIKILKASVDNIVDNWNKYSIPSNKKVLKLQDNLNDKIEKFDEKIEELNN